MSQAQKKKGEGSLGRVDSTCKEIDAYIYRQKQEKEEKGERREDLWSPK